MSEVAAKRLAALLLLAALALGACCRTVAYVPVREARFRSELTAQDRLALPLSEADKARLLAFLRAGGDTDKIGTDVVLPDAMNAYGALLARLSDGTRLALSDLTEGSSYDEWFGKLRVRQVIDAREESSPIIDPVAASDGRFWWIFYVHHGRLSGVLVVKALADRPSE